MRIAIIQGPFLPVPAVLGGAVEKMWFAVGKEFAAQGHDVVHISRAYPGLSPSEKLSGVQHHRVAGYKTPSSTLFGKLLDLCYSLRAIRSLPERDIVITNTFWSPVLLPILRKKGAYVDFSRMPKGQVPLYLKSQRIRVPSSAVADRIIHDCPAAAALVRVIPNPLPFTPSPVDFQEKLPRLLYTGRIHPEKGIELLLDAFCQIDRKNPNKDWELEIVGPWDIAEGGAGEEYKRKLMEQFPHPRIRWLGAVHDVRELNEIYARSAIFCYPSVAEHGETFGLSPLEAMSWGCATVVSDLACFRDFITHEKNGLMFDHRGDYAVLELRERLLLLMQDAPRRESVGRAGMQVRETHSSQKIANLFLSDFELVLGSESKNA